ncbi:glycosyltransferase family 39 protein [Granulicella sp. WH15]|nr:glycosyltransferase family 39 protein [Granulicella sp. WH15]
MSVSLVDHPDRSALSAALRLAAIFAVVKLLLQFGLTLWTEHLGYGYFRDEFYYLACGRHLAWGYVDHGPVVAVQARLGELLFGTSVFALRVLSSAAGAVVVWLTGVIAWALGGRRPAQALAMFGVLLCPQYIALHGFLSMNSFEPIFWSVCVLALVLVQRGYSEGMWWMVFGVSAGVGLLNKPSMTFFLIAVAIGLLCTPQRRLLATRWAAVGVGLLILIALPNLLWQAQNHWPTLEFLENGRAEHKNVILGPVPFFMQQFLNMQPMNFALWGTGVVALLRGRSIRGMRWLGVAFVVFFVTMFGLHAKDYYLAGIYPAFFAAGAIAWEHRFAARKSVRQGRVVAFPVFEGMLLVSTVLVLPMASPVLRPYTWIRYTTAMHLHGSKSETAETGPLPQFYADRFGWQQQVDTVVKAYRGLTPAEQREVCIYGDDYGEAGALDLLGRREEPSLPAAISPQNSYWMWGTHGCTGEIAIAISGGSLEELQGQYESVTVLGRMDDPLAMPFERHKHIYLLRRRRPEMPFVWEKMKDFI